MSRLDAALERLSHEVDDARIDRVVAAAREATEAEVESAVTRFGHLRSVLSPFWAARIARRERERARAWLSRPDPAAGFTDGSFEGRVYRRVEDMFSTIDFASVRRLEMVGCGPLPATLLHVADRHAEIELIGLDTDPRAIELATRLVDARRRRVALRVARGEEWDYARADLIYVANLATPKDAILARIAATRPARAPVVLRDPHGVGALFSERGVDALPAGLRVEALGAADEGFLSRHVFLR